MRKLVYSEFEINSKEEHQALTQELKKGDKMDMMTVAEHLDKMTLMLLGSKGAVLPKTKHRPAEKVVSEG